MLRINRELLRICLSIRKTKLISRQCWCSDKRDEFCLTKIFNHTKLQKMIKTSFKIFVFIFSAVLFFTACEKSNLNDVSENQVDDNTEQRILEFKTKVDNKSKSSEEITIEDAVWLTEALANYQYCKITDEKQQADLNAISIDSVFIDIHVNNNFTTIS